MHVSPYTWAYLFPMFHKSEICCNLSSIQFCFTPGSGFLTSQLTGNAPEFLSFLPFLQQWCLDMSMSWVDRDVRDLWRCGIYVGNSVLCLWTSPVYTNYFHFFLSLVVYSIKAKREISCYEVGHRTKPGVCHKMILLGTKSKYSFYPCLGNHGSHWSSILENMSQQFCLSSRGCNVCKSVVCQQFIFYQGKYCLWGWFGDALRYYDCFQSDWP